MSIKMKLLQAAAAYAIVKYTDTPKKRNTKPKAVRISSYSKKETETDKLIKVQTELNKRHYLYVTRVSGSGDDIPDSSVKTAVELRIFDKDDFPVYTIRKNESADTFSLYSDKNRKIGFVTTQNELYKLIIHTDSKKCAVFRNKNKLCTIKTSADCENNNYAVSEKEKRIRVKHKWNSHFYVEYGDKEFEVLRVNALSDWFMEGHSLEYIIGFDKKDSDLSALVLISMGLWYLW